MSTENTNNKKKIIELFKDYDTQIPLTFEIIKCGEQTNKQIINEKYLDKIKNKKTQHFTLNQWLENLKD